MRTIARNFAALWVILGTLWVAGAAEEHPYANAKVGDWVEYTTTMDMGSNKMVNGMKKEVINKTDTELTMEITTEMKNMPPMKNTIVIKLDQKNNKEEAEKAAKVKELATGSETLSIAGKSLNTKWVEAEMETANMKIKTKTWISKDIPLDGIVKSVSDNPQMKTVMELKGFGFGK